MFVYATRVLHLSEAEAYLRITVARAAREHPVLLARATHKSKREIEELLAELAPRHAVLAMTQLYHCKTQLC
jgi:hypothetical protein